MQTLNRIQQKNLKLSHENQTENKVFVKLMKLDVLIGMKHFIQMIMMTNLAILKTVVPLQTAVPYLTKFLAKSRLVIYKRKKTEKFQRKRRKRKGRTKILSVRNRKKLTNARFKLLNKKKVI